MNSLAKYIALAQYASKNKTFATINTPMKNAYSLHTWHFLQIILYKSLIPPSACPARTFSKTLLTNSVVCPAILCSRKLESRGKKIWKNN